jgi:hypothetical protein
MTRPALLARFPSWWHHPRSTPVLPADTAERYPALAEDVRTLDAVAGPAFAEADRDALADQNRHRRQQVAILLGSALLSGLGGVQAVWPDRSWPGLVLFLLGAAVTALSGLAGELRTLDRFLDARLRAERLRATHFRYLARVGPYAHAADPVLVLRRAVLAVRRGEEPS